MKKLRKRQGEPGPAVKPGLYVVSTPIGNLDDITLRALEVLRGADLVACEDTRRIRKLLSHFKIQGKELVSYYRGTELQRVDSLLAALTEGKAVALASDAGTPGIADPGMELMRRARDAGHAVHIVPGVCAAVAALTASSLPAESFLFLGYLPRKKKERRAFLSPLRWERRTLVLFEAPHRLATSLDDIAAIFTARRMALVRELTKLNEEILLGSAEQLAAALKKKRARGELTLVIDGYGEKEREVPGSWSGYSLAAHLAKVMKEEDLSLSRAVEKLEQVRDVPKEVLYQIARESGLESRKK